MFCHVVFSSAVPGGLFSFSLDPGIKITWGKAEVIIIGYIKYKETIRNKICYKPHRCLDC